MPLAEDHDVLEELSTTAADSALRRPVLPRATVRDPNRLCAHRLDELDYGGAEDRVPVKDEVSRRGVVGKRLTSLLDHPRRRRVEPGAKVQDMTWPCSMTKKPYRSRSDAVGTVNKSIAAMSSLWLRKKATQRFT